MNPNTWIVASLLAPLAAAQQSPQQGAPKAAAPAAAGYESLSVLGPAIPPGAQPALDASMAARAEAGDAHALAWCLRHPEAFGPERAQRSVEGFARLVREHAAADWLRSPGLDPVIALERSERAVRHAVAAALAAESFEDPTARSLAQLLRATALAPREEREGALAQQALGHLEELRALDPQGPWTARADGLAWRLEHLAPGRAAPALVLRDVDGNALVLEDWLDGEVLVDVWRADDPDRARRAAELAQLVERVRAQRPERGLRVLALGLGDNEGSFRRELEELELPWPTAFEHAAGGPARSAWRLDGGATRLWIDKAGRVRSAGGSPVELEALLLAPTPDETPARAELDRAGPDRSEPIRVAPNDVTSDAATLDSRRGG